MVAQEALLEGFISFRFTFLRERGGPDQTRPDQTHIISLGKRKRKRKRKADKKNQKIARTIANWHNGFNTVPLIHAYEKKKKKTPILLRISHKDTKGSNFECALVQTLLLAPVYPDSGSIHHDDQALQQQLRIIVPHPALAPSHRHHHHHLLLQPVQHQREQEQKRMPIADQSIKTIKQSIRTPDRDADGLGSSPRSENRLFDPAQYNSNRGAMLVGLHGLFDLFHTSCCLTLAARYTVF